IPYGLPLVFTAISLVYSLRVLYNTFGQRIGINNTSVKEAFDNLPTGVCFFNTSGLPVLCNLAMYRFSFAVSGKDVQYITDLEECLAEDFVPMDGVKRDGKAFILPDGRVFQIERRELSQINEEDYVQFIVSDITELYGTRCELTEENSQLRKVQQELKRLSANVVTITREEEILNTKMRVHDEMGRCLVAAQKHLRDDASGEGVGEEIVTAWQRAVSMLKYNNEANDDDMMSQIRQTCEYINLRLIETGELTSSEDVAYVLACAVRECMTNAVRYAGADELYADFSETDQDATVVLTNNGKVPDGDIVEGGGLSTLRKRVERSGGVMTVSAAPRFKLTVTVPKNKEMLS
ncbi:MAG: hypothetical protein IKV40_06360, partial [Clostridia bacterium]|nr:hypothetical protein [Clostridia bacterium]